MGPKVTVRELEKAAALLEAYTVDIPEAGRRLGYQRAQAYVLIRNRGRVPTIRIGGVYRVPVCVLEEMDG